MTADPIRDEAERFVAAALATVSGLADRHGAGLANDSAECCVCPVCRVISAVRNPSPETSERLATGVGELAAGVAGLLRAFGSPRPAPEPAADAWAAATAPGTDEPADAWAAATAPEDSPEPSAPAPKPMAKKAVRKAPPPNDTTPEQQPGGGA